MPTEHYSYRVFWSPEDGEFVGVCSEFPSLSHLAPGPEEALSGIRELVAFVLEDLRREGRAAPSALTEQPYSGNLRLRLPTNLHRRLALEAAEQQRSLNRVIVDRLIGSPSPAPEVLRKKVGSGAHQAAGLKSAKKAAKRSVKSA